MTPPSPPAPPDKDPSSDASPTRAHRRRACGIRIAYASGLLCSIASIALYYRLQADPDLLDPQRFLVLWLGAALLVSGYALLLLGREATRRPAGDRLPVAFLAERALPPALVGILSGSVAILGTRDALLATALWILGYGLALMSLSPSSRGPLRRLGLAFVTFGLMVFIHGQFRAPTSENAAVALAVKAMGVAFGGLHLIHGLLLSASEARRRRRRARAQGESPPNPSP